MTTISPLNGEEHDPAQYCDLDVCKREGCTHLADTCHSRQKTAPLSRPSAASDGLRTFDTTGTVFRRTGNVLSITCENPDVANRVADQLRTPVEPQPTPVWQPIETAPKDGTLLLVAVYTEIYGWVRGTSYWVSEKGLSGWISRGIAATPGELGLAHPTRWQPLPTCSLPRPESRP